MKYGMRPEKKQTAQGKSKDFPSPSAERVIRVFVSSTFRDMQKERDELVKVVFPQFRRECERRNVTCFEVDLRWGVTDEEVSEKRTIDICFDQIDRCYPFFIGLLGTRYGGVLDTFPQQVIERHPWLSAFRGSGLTELEIRYAALQRHNPYALFYVRSGTKTNNQFIEREELLESPSQLARLASLKQELQTRGYQISTYYSVTELGQQILSALLATLDRLFPQTRKPTRAESETLAHEIFAKQLRLVSVPRPSYRKNLDAHARSGGAPLILTGPPGAGTSSILANWLESETIIRTKEKASSAEPQQTSIFRKILARFHNDQQPNLIAIAYHFVGASPQSTQWDEVIRRITVKLLEQLHLQLPIPEIPEELPSFFTNVLSMAAQRGKCLIVIDGLDMLSDRDRGNELYWLPQQIPENVRLVIGCNTSPILQKLKERSWQILRVAPLEQEIRLQLLERYLASFGKRLAPRLEEQIIGTFQAGNPLFLRTLLSELRTFGEYERLNERITFYSEAPSIDELIERVLTRLENDPTLIAQKETVSSCLAFLAIARHGLSEAELCDLLGSAGTPLPASDWSRVYISLSGLITDRAGLLSFSHRYICQVVTSRYLRESEINISYQQRVAAYFIRQVNTQMTHGRTVEELPWQLKELQAWPQLQNLLINPGFLRIAWANSSFEVSAYWRTLEAEAGIRADVAYNSIVGNPLADPHYAWITSLILRQQGYTDSAIRIDEVLVEHFRRVGDENSLERCLGNLAVARRASGHLPEAFELLQQQADLCRRTANMTGLRACLGNQGIILRNLGRLDDALRCHAEEKRLGERIGDPVGVRKSAINTASILAQQGKTVAAQSLLKDHILFCQQTGDKVGLHVCLGNLGRLSCQQGDYQEAVTLHSEEERLCRELGDIDGLLLCLVNKASAL